jgi:DNA polymerase-3 subunit gamma/tau
VLNVFGFTSEQTVAAFTEKVLRGNTSGALAALDEQAAAGKEMMKLMNDLIAHLRDLLVYKVKPEALSDETVPELQASLGEEASLVETGRLLELIEQFAEAEGRMKWAPNKKLHFEVAVIKAIQTLGQVTLDEVIENLAALRGGEASVSSVAKTLAPPKSANSPAPVVSAPASSAAPADMAETWPKLVQLVYKRRPLIRDWINAARFLGVQGREVLVGFAPEEKLMMESLARPTNRSFLEGLLKELTGSEWTLKLKIAKDLPPAEPPPPETQTEPEATKPNDPIESFKDDPLIKEALEIFKGEIKSVTT